MSPIAGETSSLNRIFSCGLDFLTMNVIYLWYGFGPCTHEDRWRKHSAIISGDGRRGVLYHDRNCGVAGRF